MMERKERSIERQVYEGLVSVGDHLYELITREEGTEGVYLDKRMFIINGLIDVAKERYESLLKG